MGHSQPLFLFFVVFPSKNSITNLSENYPIGSVEIQTHELSEKLYNNWPLVSGMLEPSL